MRNYAALGFVVSVFFADYALAADAGDALKAFGLIGAWSPNCVMNPRNLFPTNTPDQMPVRWVYSASTLSSPTYVIVRLDRGNNLMIFTANILAAEQVTDSKIKYKQVAVSQKLGDRPPQAFSNPLPAQVIVEKLNNKIRIVSHVADDGTVFVENGFSIIRLPRNGAMQEVNRVQNGWVEKCLDE
jgi:hypothetical protein